MTETIEETILSDFPIQTDEKIKSNRLDIVVKDYKKKAFFLIDIAIPTDIISQWCPKTCGSVLIYSMDQH